MTDLEALTKELKDHPYNLDSLQCVLVAQFILKDRERIVQPLVEYKSLPMRERVEQLKNEAIDDTLIKALGDG
jgi:hypothetical protein